MSEVYQPIHANKVALSRVAVLAESGHLTRILDSVIQKLSSDPKNLVLILTKAQILRQLGRLNEAGELFEEIGYSYEASLMKGEIPSCAPKQNLTPFVLASNPLPSSLIARIDADYRGSNELLCQDIVDEIFDHERDFVVNVGKRFFDNFQFTGADGRYLSYRTGDYFFAHRDDGPEGSDEAFRKLTVIHYLELKPGIRGGNVLLHDKDWSGWTLLCPKPGDVVCFPSSSIHEVTPLVSDGVRYQSGDVVRIAMPLWYRI